MFMNTVYTREKWHTAHNVKKQKCSDVAQALISSSTAIFPVHTKRISSAAYFCPLPFDFVYTTAVREEQIDTNVMQQNVRSDEEKPDALKVDTSSRFFEQSMRRE